MENPKAAWLTGAKGELTQPGSISFSNSFLINTSKILEESSGRRKLPAQLGWRLVILGTTGLFSRMCGSLCSRRLVGYFRQEQHQPLCVSKESRNLFFFLLILFCWFPMKHQLCFLVYYAMHSTGKKLYAKIPKPNHQPNKTA